VDGEKRRLGVGQRPRQRRRAAKRLRLMRRSQPLYHARHIVRRTLGDGGVRLRKVPTPQKVVPQ
ncbi:hypothetical protein, partial [Pseudomonas sp. FW306-02-H05-AB]|uniref:hypothetical protein n=1 Tax=Pseudomonas sp. FW306-02-H05-AB TaxID=2070666 RepID=UPI001C455AE5